MKRKLNLQTSLYLGKAVTILLNNVNQKLAYFVYSFMLTDSELMVPGAVHTIDKFMTVMHDLH